MAAASYAWVPAAGPSSLTQVEQFMAAHGIATFDDLRRRAVAEPAWFWSAVVDFLAIPFADPFTSVVDTTNGIEWATWFKNGTLNLAAACVDRWAESDGDREAVVWEGEDGSVRTWTYDELQSETDRLAFTLAGRGIGEGDAVGIYMPMIPETVAAVMAVAKLGAVFLPLFSGYGVDAVVARLEDAGAKALVTADGFFRRGKQIDMWAVAGEAALAVSSVHTVIVVPRLGREVESAGGRNLPWPEPVGHEHY